MKRFLKKLLLVTSVFCLLLIAFYIFHAPILRFFGNRLIHEDKMEKVPAVFVLSGDPFDRGKEAMRLYNQNLAEKIVCTGENVPELFKIVELEYIESELTKKYLVRQGVPDSAIFLITKGTSTKEESDYILDYCIENNLKKVAVISTKFHTRRVENTFRKKFKNAGIQLIIRGAPSSAYDEKQWWASESGLIFVNNEYIKIMYYWLRRF